MATMVVQSSIRGHIRTQCILYRPPARHTHKKENVEIILKKNNVAEWGKRWKRRKRMKKKRRKAGICNERQT